MGKRQRRRNREQSGRKRPQAPVRPVPRVLFPSTEQPLLEVHIAPGTPNEVRAMCVGYWEFSEPGTWARNVAAIGNTHEVLKAVKGNCHASLLTVECPQCATPATVTTRSDLAATRLWHADAFPREPVKAGAPCQECRAAAAAARAAEQARETEQRSKQTDQRVANASQWIADHRKVRQVEEDLDPQAALALLAITEILERNEKDSVGPLNTLPYTITGRVSDDITVVKELYAKHWLAPTLPATIDDFSFDNDNNVKGVYVDQVPWRLAYWLGEDKQQAVDSANVAAFLTLDAAPARVRELLTEVEATMAVDYLEGLMTRKYNEEPIPEHRLPDAFAIARGALESGFTLEQMVAVAWSAAAGAVAWGQRTPGLKPGSVSSAAVTTMERRVGYAKDRPVVEYDLPNWLARPAVRATARRFLADQQHIEASQTALRNLHTLLQRVNSRPPDTAELDDDLSENHPKDGGQSFQQFLDDLRTGTPPRSTGAAKAFAVISPDGRLTIQSATLDGMRAVAGAPHGLAEHVMIHDTPRLAAVVPVFIDHHTHPANPVAAQMLELLGTGPDGANGNVVFYQTDGHNRFVGLDDDVHQLLQAAHEAASVHVAREAAAQGTVHAE